MSSRSMCKCLHVGQKHCRRFISPYASFGYLLLIKGGRRVSRFLIFADQGGRWGLPPPYFGWRHMWTAPNIKVADGMTCEQLRTNDKTCDMREKRGGPWRLCVEIPHRNPHKGLFVIICVVSLGTCVSAGFYCWLNTPHFLTLIVLEKDLWPDDHNISFTDSG